MIYCLAIATRFAPKGKLGAATGIVYTGVGIGIFLSGSLIPWLLSFSLAIAWLGIASIGFLAFSNARERQSEIGILRAMGTPTGSILGALLSRAVLVGLLGSGLTLILAVLLSENLRGGTLQGFDLRSLQEHIPLVLISAPILTCVASWFPALHATNRDPASILRND